MKTKEKKIMWQPYILIDDDDDNKNVEEEELYSQTARFFFLHL